MFSFFTGKPPLTTPALAITSCDSFDGLTLALCLASRLRYKFKNCHKNRGIDNPANPQLLCLAQDTTKCGDLNKNPFCKVVQISYDDPDTISIALRGVQTVVFVPEIEPQRVDWADCMIDAMKNEQVVRCVAVSCIGTDAPEKDQLDRFRRVEDRIKKDIPRWTILREGFPFQALFYWIPMVVRQGVLGMPIKPEIEFAPLDIVDLCRAVIEVTVPRRARRYGLGVGVSSGGGGQGNDGQNNGNKDNHNDIWKALSNLKLGATTEPALPPPPPRIGVTFAGDSFEKHDGQTYTLTGPETVTGPKLADELTRALRKEKDKDDEYREHKDHRDDKDKEPNPIVFKELTREEFRNYLLTLRGKPSKVVPTLPVPAASTESLPTSNFIQFIQRLTGTIKGGVSSNAHPRLTGDDDALLGPPSDNGEDIAGDKPPEHGQGPVLGAPNDTEIDLILELLDYINENRATFQSGDLEKITGERGNDAKRFFEQNGSDFRPHRPSTVILESSSTSNATTALHSEEQQQA
ncbi:hypothetical protein BGZ95_004858 [Linnemannia exigua]|uniref:NAD(P)-binding domain-containing protein n=1 Tax=Linnemannia exigua TaxID=604196 RepID=A0AAD4D2J9_9FUNG|nr:hypothetical protein BGZ95_004858 [Linnemannia exigua]